MAWKTMRLIRRKKVEHKVETCSKKRMQRCIRFVLFDRNHVAKATALGARISQAGFFFIC